jgi:cytochrome b561
MSNPVERYSPPARALHWLVAIGILAALVLALLIPDGEERTPAIVRAIGLHRFAGVAVLLLVVLRVLWRLVRRPPELPSHFRRIEQIVTHAGHGLLYVLMAAVPLGGWLLSGAMGLDAFQLGGITLPDLVAKQPKAVAETIHDLHEFGAWSLVVLAGLHAAAAVKHHVTDKEGFLRRMM